MWWYSLKIWTCGLSKTRSMMKCITQFDCLSRLFPLYDLKIHIFAITHKNFLGGMDVHVWRKAALWKPNRFPQTKEVAFIFSNEKWFLYLHGFRELITLFLQVLSINTPIWGEIRYIKSITIKKFRSFQSRHLVLGLTFWIPRLKTNTIQPRHNRRSSPLPTLSMSKFCPIVCFPRELGVLMTTIKTVRQKQYTMGDVPVTYEQLCCYPSPCFRKQQNPVYR